MIGLAVSAHISIHALREESDLTNGGIHCLRLNISIHALREESDGDMRIQRLRLHDFNPRSP